MGEGGGGVWCGGRRRAAVAGSSARRGSCGGSSSTPRGGQKGPARARERKGVGAARASATGAGAAPAAGTSVPPPWAACGARAGRAAAGLGRGRSGHLGRPPHLVQATSAAPAKSGGGGGEKWWKAGGWHTGAGGTRGRMGGAMRVARGAGGGSPTQGGRRRHEDLVPVTAAEPSGSYRRPPRGVEPRTLPAIRPTGRPGQRVLLRRTLEKGPSGQPTQAVKMVKAEGLRGLRAKVRGEGGCDHWGHALTRAHARSCLAEPRTDSTCSTCAVGGPLGRGIRICWERHFAWMDFL